ncbi:MAG: hypothetical protein ACXAC7_18615 [Candidatus Hodarchaeales archaeon]
MTTENIMPDKQMYWSTTFDYAFPIHRLWTELKGSPNKDQSLNIQRIFIEEGLALQKMGVKQVRLMSDTFDITLPIEKLDKNKLETFITSIIRTKKLQPKRNLIKRFKKKNPLAI